MVGHNLVWNTKHSNFFEGKRQKGMPPHIKLRNLLKGDEVAQRIKVNAAQISLGKTETTEVPGSWSRNPQADFSGCHPKKKYVSTILLLWINLTKIQISGAENYVGLALWVMYQLHGGLVGMNWGKLDTLIT